MGCDGGTIPKRDELVRTKKKKEQVINLSRLVNKLVIFNIDIFNTDVKIKNKSLGIRYKYFKLLKFQNKFIFSFVLI